MLAFQETGPTATQNSSFLHQWW